MKEATGELNMTVVTVVAITAIAAFFYAFVWPAIKNSIIINTNCTSAFGCVPTVGDAKTNTCQYYPIVDGKQADNPEPVVCPAD